MSTYISDQSNPASATPVYMVAAGKPANITTNIGTTVKTGRGSFYSLTVNIAGTGSVATVYDGTSAAGILIGTFSTDAQITLSPNVAFTIGLYIVTTGSSPADITVSYA